MDNKNVMVDTPIVAYMLHDAVNNVEGIVTDFSEESLKKASDAGMQFIAIHGDESRELVPYDEVVEPQPQMNGVTLCQPKYVDDRINAVMLVLDSVIRLVESLASPLKRLGISTLDTSELDEALDRLRSFTTDGATDSTES